MVFQVISNIKRIVSRSAKSITQRITLGGNDRGVTTRERLDLSRGSVQRDERPLLRQLVEEANRFSGPIIEIGTLFGMTTLELLRWAAPEKKILTVDNYSWNPYGFAPDEHRALASAILSLACERGNVEIISQAKDEFYRDYNGPPPALVFLDADHAYRPTRDDIAWAVGTACPIICGHDYSPEFPGVMQAVGEAGGLAALLGTVWRLNAVPSASIN